MVDQAQKAERLRMMLREANVPNYVIPRSLPMVGRQDLRDMIMDKDYLNTDAAKTMNLYLYPKRTEEYAHSKVIAHLLGKELCLSGASVFVAPLDVLVDAIEHKDEYLFKKLNAPRIVVLTDFYEAGAPCPVAARTMMAAKRWINERVQNTSLGLFLQSSSTMDAATEWWSVPFIAGLRPFLTVMDCEEGRGANV